MGKTPSGEKKSEEKNRGEKTVGKEVVGKRPRTLSLKFIVFRTGNLRSLTKFYLRNPRNLL